MKKSALFLALAVGASAQILSPIFFQNGLAIPSLLTHTLFACNTGTCTSGSGTSPLAGAAISTTGASLIIASVVCNATLGMGQGNKFVLTDSQSNTWVATYPTNQSNNTITQLVYVLSPSTSASHTFTIATAGGCGSATVAIASFKDASVLTGFSSASLASSATIQPGSLTPIAGSVAISNGYFFLTSGTAPTVDSGFTITDSTAYHSTVSFPHALGYLIGSTSALNPTWTTTGGTNPAASNSAVFSSASGATATPPTLRCSGQLTQSSNTFNLNFCSGSTAGDTAVIFASHGWSISTPGGWTALANNTGAVWNGMVAWKVLSSGDISTGHVTISMGGSDDGYTAIAVFPGSVTPTLPFVWRDQGSFSSGIASGTAVPAGYYALYEMGVHTNVTASITDGSHLQNGTDGGAVAGALYGRSFSTAAGATPTYTVSGSVTGYYLALVLVH